MARKNNEVDLTEGPILKKILVMAVAVFGTVVLQQLFNTADLLVVGRFGKEGAIASVGACSSLINLFINLFVGLGAGSGIVMAKHYGSKNFEGAQKCLHTAVCVSVIGGIALAVFAWITAPFMLENVLDTPKENGVLNGAITYMRFYFLGMPFMLLFNFSSAILRAVGDAKRTFFYIMQAGVINVLLNLLFVIVFDLNVKGVALATVSSQFYCAVRCTVCFLKYDGVLKLHPNKLRIDKEAARDIAKLGIPSGIQSSLFSISNVLIQSSINSFGTAAMAGSSAAANIEMYASMPGDSVNNAIINYTSQNYGANNPDRIKKGAIYAFIMIVAVTVAVSTFMVVFAEELLGFYSVTKAEEVKYGVMRLTIMGLTCVMCNLMNLPACLLKGIFKPVQTMVISIVCICVFRVVWLYTVFAKFHDFRVLFLSYPITWVIAFLANGAVFLYCFKQYKQRVAAFSKKV